MSNLYGFRITGKRGFHVGFENGYVVSVQFGPGNYADNYDMEIGREDEEAGKIGSTTAECAVWKPDGEMVQPFDRWNNIVSNRSTPAEVLELLNWACAQTAPDSEPIRTAENKDR